MQAIDEAIDKVQQPIIDQLNAWLCSMEGKTLSVENSEQNIQDIESMRNLIRRAGCELFYGIDIVQIRLIDQKRAKNFKISLRSKGSEVQKILYAQTHFPKLEVRAVKVFEEELS